MKRILIASLLLLGACATTPTVQQSLYGLDATYAGLAPVATAAIQSGKLDAPTIAKVKQAFQVTHDALMAASAAEASGAGNAAALVAVAQSSLSSLTNLLIQNGVK